MPERSTSAPGPNAQLYNSRKWRKASGAYKQAYPFCEVHTAAGLTAAAFVTDHMIPIEGEHGSVWSTANWCSLCNECHQWKRAMERHGMPVTKKGTPMGYVPEDRQLMIEWMAKERFG